MGKRLPNEAILARWFVDAAALQTFLRETRLRAKRSSFAPEGLRKECEKHASGPGLEVVFRADALFVGDWGAPNTFYAIKVHDTWLQLLGDEGYHVPVPLAPSAKADAERIATLYAHRYLEAQANQQRHFLEQRSTPTWNNRLLNFAEAHFIWLLLAFFFVLLPLVVLLVGLLRGSLTG